MSRTANRSGDDLRADRRSRKSRKLAPHWSSAWLATALAVGCASQEEPDDASLGKSGSANNGGKASGGSGGSGGTSSAGKTNGGTDQGGTSSAGGSSGMSSGGSAGASGGKGGGGAGGAGGSGGSAGAGGKGGSGGTAGSGGAGGKGGGGAGGSSGSGGASGGGTGGAAVDTCKNTMKDGTETDVDCGGPCAARCATGKGCSTVGDCVDANVCDMNACRANGCSAANCAYALTHYEVGTSGAKGQVLVTWSATALALDFQISDATPVDDSALNWEDDSVEVYLDLNQGKTTTYEDDDFQITIPRAAGALSGVGAFTAAAITIVRSSDASGYRIQATIPWSALNGAASHVGETIGFDAGVNDDNLNGTRDGQIILYGTLNNYQDTSQFGELTLTP